MKWNACVPFLGIFPTLNFKKKCLHGRIANSNESFNNVIWSRIQKSTSVQLCYFTGHNIGHQKSIQLRTRLGCRYRYLLTIHGLLEDKLRTLALAARSTYLLATL